MGVISDRLQALYKLRDRVALEIRAEQRRLLERGVSTADVNRPTAVSAGTVRRWARANGIDVGTRGKLGADVWAAYYKAHP